MVIQSNRFLSREKKEEDIAFYHDQKNKRMTSMQGKDKVLHGQLLRQQKRLSYQLETRNSNEAEMSTEDMSPKSFTAQYSIRTASSCSEEFQQQTTRRVNEVTLKAPRNIMDTIERFSVLDRLKISDNAATMLMSSFITVCHGDVDDFHLSSDG